MKEETHHSGIKIQMFVGFLIKSDLRMYLNQSSNWKISSIASEDNENTLKEISHQTKSYIGKFLSTETLNIKDLEKHGTAMKHRLKDYCPTIATENLEVYIFPQIFIS